MLTITIGYRIYGLEFLGGSARLTKPGGETVYQVELTDDPSLSCHNGLACDCPDFRYRHAGTGSPGCKHCQALATAGLLPLLGLPLALTGA